jgi:nucleoside-diphosphate-sugar epimerase
MSWLRWDKRARWIGDNPVVELSLKRKLKLGWRPKVSSEEAIRGTARWNLEHETRQVKD